MRVVALARVRTEHMNNEIPMEFYFHAHIIQQYITSMLYEHGYYIFVSNIHDSVTNGRTIRNRGQSQAERPDKIEIQEVRRKVFGGGAGRDGVLGTGGGGRSLASVKRVEEISAPRLEAS